MSEWDEQMEPLPAMLPTLKRWRDELEALADALEGLFTPCAPGCTDCVFHRIEGLIAVMERTRATAVIDGFTPNAGGTH